MKKYEYIVRVRENIANDNLTITGDCNRNSIDKNKIYSVCEQKQPLFAQILHHSNVKCRIILRTENNNLKYRLCSAWTEKGELLLDTFPNSNLVIATL